MKLSYSREANGNDAYLLLVEDDVALGENMEELLEDAGQRVVRCTSAEQALARSDLDRCRAVITDLRLPGLNGLELLEELAKRRNRLPCLVVTALPDERLYPTAEGPNAFLTKPVNLKKLLEWASHPR